MLQGIGRGEKVGALHAAGAAAAALLEQAGMPAGATLAQLCARAAAHFEARGGELVSLLGMQVQLAGGGAPLACLLAQRMQPAALLTAQHVRGFPASPCDTLHAYLCVLYVMQHVNGLVTRAGPCQMSCMLGEV
jgi:hypothetical protein